MREQKIFYLDARIRVFLVIVLSCIAVTVQNNLYLLGFTGLVVLVMAGSGAVRPALKAGAVILTVCGLQMLCMEFVQGSVRTFVLTVLQILPRFLFLRLLGLSLTRTLSTGEIIETLERLRLPRQLVIPFAVMLRFLPTIRLEMGYIHENLKIRGIDDSIVGFLKSPIRWMEYMLVPVLMRSMRLAEELSAAAMVRGIENKVSRAWIYGKEKQRYAKSDLTQRHRKKRRGVCNE